MSDNFDALKAALGEASERLVRLHAEALGTILDRLAKAGHQVEGVGFIDPSERPASTTSYMVVVGRGGVEFAHVWIETPPLDAEPVFTVRSKMLVACAG